MEIMGRITRVESVDINDNILKATIILHVLKFVGEFLLASDQMSQKCSYLAQIMI